MIRLNMKKYMFDTNIFNDILDGQLNVSELVGKAHFFVTHVQHDEIQAAKDEKRREKLALVFECITQYKVPTESFVLDTLRLDEAKLGNDSVVPTESSVYGVSRYGQSKYTSENNLYEPIKVKLDSLKKKDNNIQDALIAETAIKNNFTLVTHDKNLFSVVTELKGAAANLYEVLKELF